MAPTRDKFVTRLAAISRDLAALVRDVTGETPAESADFPAEAAEQMARGICLDCGDPIGDDKQARRGLHARCYQRAMRVMSSGKLKESQLISAGALAPPSTPGPKIKGERSRIADLLAAVDERPIEAVAPILEAAVEMQAEERRDKSRDRKKRPNKKTR